MLWRHLSPLYHLLCGGPRLSAAHLSAHFAGLAPLDGLPALATNAHQQPGAGSESDILSQVQVATDYFIERASLSDWEDRVGWLKYIAQTCQVDAAIIARVQAVLSNGAATLQAVMCSELFGKAAECIKQSIPSELLLESDQIELEVWLRFLGLQL